MNLCNSKNMKKALSILLILFSFLSHAQKTENIIIITTDGFRWQEIFKGMDPVIANDKKFNQETALTFTKNIGILILKNRVRN